MLEPTALSQKLHGWLSRVKPEWRNLTVASLNVATGSGFSAQIFFADVSYEDDHGPQQRGLVVRLQPQNHEVVFGSDLKIQAQMMAALNVHGNVPVPAWVGMEADPSLLGSPFIVMGRVDGKAATQKPNYNLEGFLVDFTPEQRLQTWTNAIDAFAEIHKIPWQDGFTFLERPEYGEPGLDQFIGLLANWHRAAAKGRVLPIVDAGMAYVLNNRPADAECCVLWGDPTPSNTMFKPDGSVAALVDWELAALGPPELDISWWLYFDDLFGRRFGVKRLPGLPDREQTVAIYEAAAGRKMKHLEYYDIVAALRMALVAVGAFDRQVGLGNIPPENKSLDNNFMTQYLAEKLGLPLPEFGKDFADFMRALVPVDEPAH